MIDTTTKISLRKLLYEATRIEHKSVENVFNFREESLNNLQLFYTSILKTRTHYRLMLSELELRLQIKTYNENLIRALEEDSKINSHNLDTVSYSFDLDKAIGVFYVFAGSSLGAAEILKIVNREKPGQPAQYLNFLTQVADHQMITLKKLLEIKMLDSNQLIESAIEAFNTIKFYATNKLRRTS